MPISGGPAATTFRWERLSPAGLPPPPSSRAGGWGPPPPVAEGRAPGCGFLVLLGAGSESESGEVCRVAA